MPDEGVALQSNHGDAVVLEDTPVALGVTDGGLPDDAIQRRSVMTAGSTSKRAMAAGVVGPQSTRTLPPNRADVNPRHSPGA